MAFNLQKNDLTKICLLLFTLLTLSGAVCGGGDNKDCIDDDDDDDDDG